MCFQEISVAFQEASLGEVYGKHMSVQGGFQLFRRFRVGFQMGFRVLHGVPEVLFLCLYL